MTSTPIRLAPGWIPISALLDLTRYINSIYSAGHFVTPKQADSTYHIYRDIHIGHIPEIQYNLDRKCFEPKDVHINLELFERALEEYQFLNTFAEDPEKPEHESTEVEEKFFIPPQSLRPETPRPLTKELPPESPSFSEPIKEEPSVESIPQHRTLKPVKSALKVRFQQ